MNGRQRLAAVFDGRIPDRVPHMEMAFQLEEEAFQTSWPSKAEMDAATPAERERLLHRHLDICQRIIDTYNWAGIRLPTDLHGYFPDQVIPLGRRQFGDRAMIYDFNGHGTFWMQPGDKMMDFVIKLFERPEELHAEARQKCDASIALAHRQIDQGADFIIINSDYGYNRGPFISPTMFAEFITPYLTEIVGAIHRMGVKAILHSDGD